jgi:hypothetical protein
MTQSATWLRVLRRLATVGALIIATSCAATGPANRNATAASPAGNTTYGTPADETPASTRNLVDTAALTTKAEQEGFKPEIHDGDVFYCRKQVDFSERTRIPTRQCVDEDGLRQLLLREQQQRDEMRRMTSSPVCPSGTAC